MATNVTGYYQLSISPNSVINGNDNLCAAPNTYNISNLPAGATVAWSTNPTNLTTPSTGTGATFTINRDGSAYGNITLTANVSTPACGLVQTITKTIKVGIVLSDLNVRYNRNAGISQNIDFGTVNNKTVYTQTGSFAVTAFTSLAGTNTFNWVVMGPPPGSGYGWSNFTKSGPNCSFTLTGTNAPTIPLQVTLTNSQNGCTASIDKIVVFVASIPGGTSSNIVISPNPATEAIKIQELDASTGLQKTTSTITAIELIDKTGNTVYSKTFNTKMAPSPISIPVSQFKNDIYTLRIFNGTESEVQQIIIQH